MKSMDRVLALEAVLFWKGEPTTRAALAEFLAVSEGELQSAVEELRERLMGRGVRLLEVYDTLALVTAPEVAELIARITKEELSRDIGKAGLETLSVILYRGPLSKPEIDYIRGVNTSSTLRTLLSRGLLERTENPEDAREYLYRPAIELLAHLGIKNGKELPEYATIAAELAAFEQANGPRPENGVSTDT
ncbi:MAG: Segregation and condensation protein B [Parcubacteria group bacterium GW2011_GWF2_52_12]|nr:MAG: Segregation and condensation protein B [Parcubacteria group bacterium GW2011_GWF2_52_12]